MLLNNAFFRYNKQFDLCQQIVREFDRELDDDDGEEDKQRQFEKVMNLMQAMQMLGNPPKEICGEAPPGGVLPGMGGGGPDQCKQS